MHCPKCGQENLLEDECNNCGIFVSKYIEIQTRKKNQPIDPSPIPIELHLSQVFFKYRKIIFLVLSMLFISYLLIEFKHTSNLTRLGLWIGIGYGLKIVLEMLLFGKHRQRRTSYYRDRYLKSDDWKRKRGLVLKRDGHKCIFCGAQATQVHHKRYAPQNIGREPIEWLVSVCDECHRRQHGK